MLDVIRRLGTEEFPRLRIGIGMVPPQWDVADYVLSSFGSDERKEIEAAISTAARGLADWVCHGIDYCMNQYNGN